MLPTLRQLHYLKLLGEHRSFSRAADAAHVTQPTLSAGIQELERILGAQLVDRNRSGVILTAAGMAAASRAQAILDQAEDLVHASRDAGQPLAGRFRLGVIPTIAPFLLPIALPGLRRRYPRLRLFLREDLTFRLIAELKSGVLDAVLIALPYDIEGLEYAEVAEDELLVAVPRNHRLAACARIAPDQLEAEELIQLEDGHCLRDQSLAACGPSVLRPQRDEGFDATSLSTLVQMVGMGLGVSILPAMAVKSGLAGTADVLTRPLAAQKACRQIVLAWRAGSSRGAEGRLLAEAFGSADVQAVDGQRQEDRGQSDGGESEGRANQP